MSIRQVKQDRSQRRDGYGRLSLLWLSFAGVTFSAYVALVVSGSGDFALLWIIGFVVIGRPTMGLGATAAIVLTPRGDSGPPPSFRTVVGLSLLGWGGAAMAAEVATSIDYLPAALLWIAAPTVASAGSVLATHFLHTRRT